MKFPTILSLLFLSVPAFAGTAPELSTGQVNGEYRSIVYAPGGLGYKSAQRKISFNGITTSLGVRTQLTENLTLRTAVGYTTEFSDETLQSDRYLQASIQNTVFRFGHDDEEDTSGEHLYLTWGFSGHRMNTTDGYLSSLAIVTGLGFGYYSDGFGWNLEVEQNESFQSSDLDVGNGIVLKSNQFSFLNYTAGISYHL